VVVTEPFIQIEDLWFAYGDHPVLRELDFELKAGERVGLVGANGSGKTTLLHLLVGLESPDRGTIEMFGRPRSSEADFREVRARAGLLFQDPEDQLFCPTVREDVAFGPLNLGHTPEDALEIVAETLAALGLQGYGDRITYKLSGGEKRLVSLACVLAMEPDVLLLDEPSEGLDDEMRGRVVEILQGLPQGLLVVSHDREFLGSVTNRAVRLHGGKTEPFDLSRPISHTR
jgi:cobalt/nickel transport system ATP-binding protein